MIHLSPEGFAERRLTFPWSRRRVPPAYWCSSPPIGVRGLLQTLLLERSIIIAVSHPYESLTRAAIKAGVEERDYEEDVIKARGELSVADLVKADLPVYLFTLIPAGDLMCSGAQICCRRIMGSVQLLAGMGGYVHGFRGVEKGRDVDENWSLVEITEPTVGLQHTAQGITPQCGWEVRFPERILCTNSGPESVVGI